MIEKPTCKYCHKPLIRRRDSKGRLETPSHFKRKSYCNMECRVAHQRQKGKFAGNKTKSKVFGLPTQQPEYYAPPLATSGKRCQKHPDQTLNAYSLCPICEAVKRRHSRYSGGVDYTVDHVT